jgi:3-phosphoshikimate 1-carboxyvinyltransferase
VGKVANAPKSVEIAPFGASPSKDMVLECPPDKSITHRSVIFASMAKGTSEIRKPLMGADCRSTMAAFRALGVTFFHRGDSTDSIVVESPGWDGWVSPVTPLDFGNSGTTARLLTGVFAASPHLFVTAFGDESLSHRPMGRVTKPLRKMGATLLGRKDAAYLPLGIQGGVLSSAHHEVDKASAQVKSALILAGLNIQGETSVTLPAGGRDHTEKMLKSLGAQLTVRFSGKEEIITVKGPFRPAPQVFAVPGDPSSAAFFMVLGALRLSGQLTMKNVLVNDTRTGFLKVLRKMGVRVESTPAREGGGLLEPVCDLTVTGGATLSSVETEPDDAPSMIDEIPILAVCALFAKGTSVFRGLGELRVKESDRLAKVIDLLKTAGGKAWAEGDDLYVEGLPGKVGPFSFDPAKDHRLAMAASVLARRAHGPCKILDPECVDVSFPNFYSALAQVDA